MDSVHYFTWIPLSHCKIKISFVQLQNVVDDTTNVMKVMCKHRAEQEMFWLCVYLGEMCSVAFNKSENITKKQLNCESFQPIVSSVMAVFYMIPRKLINSIIFTQGETSTLLRETSSGYHCSGGSSISRRGGRSVDLVEGWTPEVVMFRKFCISKRKNLDP